MGEGSAVDARAENAWLRSYPYWDAYFGIVLVATIAIIVVDGGSPAGIVPLLLLAVSYALWGRTAVRRPPGWGRKSWWHAGAMIVLFTVAFVVAPQSSVVLSAL